MQGLRLFTTRLELVAATLELAQAEMSDLSALAELLDVPQPGSWPPPLNDEHSQLSFLASLQKAEPGGLELMVLHSPRATGVGGERGIQGPSERWICGDWIQRAGSASAQRVLHGSGASSHCLGLSRPGSADGDCAYFAGTDAVDSCDGEVWTQVYRRRTDRGWNADNSVRAATEEFMIFEF